MNKLQMVRGKVAKWGAGVGSMLVAGAAMADDDQSGTVITELSSGKTQILAVGGAILVLAAVVALIRHIRSAAK